MRNQHRVIRQAFRILVGCLLLPALLQAMPITVGSFDGTRTSMPFDGGAFDQARASLVTQFGSINDVSYPTIPNAPIPVDLLFLTNAGMTVPLSTDEQTGLVNFVNGGGTLLLSAFSDGSPFAAATAASLLEPFAASTTGRVSDGSRFYPTIPNLPAEIFEGVLEFNNSNASEITTGGQGAVTAAMGVFGPVLVYYPTIPNTPVPRLGQAIIYSNASAFADSDNRGHFSENSPLFTNIASSAAPGAVPVPATLALFGIGLAGLGWSRRKQLS